MVASEAFIGSQVLFESLTVVQSGVDEVELAATCVLDVRVSSSTVGSVEDMLGVNDWTWLSSNGVHMRLLRDGTYSGPFYRSIHKRETTLIIMNVCVPAGSVSWIVNDMAPTFKINAGDIWVII